MNKSEYRPGQLCWVDLSSNAPAKVTPFYEGLFGWEAVHDADDGGDYTMFLIDGGRVAGLVPTHAKGANSSWNAYVRAGSANDVVHAARDNGGKVVMDATDFGRTGQAACIADSNGAALGAWVPGDHRGAVLAAEAGAFCHAELATPDLDRAQNFYRSVFPWEFYPREDKPFVDVVADGECSFVMRKTEAGEKSGWTTFFGVPDLAAALKTVKTMRGAVRRPAKQGPTGLTAQVSDPAGGRFGLLEVHES